jgi:hypothetical protein
MRAEVEESIFAVTEMEVKHTNEMNTIKEA